MKLPLKIVYNTDYYNQAADAEDMANRYVNSVEDAEGKTICYTEGGYFEMPEAHAQQIVTAVNTHAGLVAACLRVMNSTHFSIDNARNRTREALDIRKQLETALAKVTP